MTAALVGQKWDLIPASWLISWANGKWHKHQLICIVELLELKLEAAQILINKGLVKKNDGTPAQ